MRKPEKENKLLLWRNVKDDTGCIKREHFRLEDIHQIGMRKGEKGRGTGETSEKTQS